MTYQLKQKIRSYMNNDTMCKRYIRPEQVTEELNMFEERALIFA